MEVTPSELPLEGLGCGAVVILEAKQAILQLLEIGEVVWHEGFSLEHGEVDFDLIEPARVCRRMDNDDVGPLSLESLLAGLSAM